jgi:hypothetical protein
MPADLTKPLPKCPAKKARTLLKLECAGDFSHSDYYPPDDFEEHRYTKDERYMRRRVLPAHRRKKKRVEDYHFPCPICCCSNTAGLGTTHHGYGLCHTHERDKRYRHVAKQMAEAHLLSLQQHNPKYFADAIQHMDAIIKKGEVLAPEKMLIEQECDKVGKLLSNFYDACSQHDSDAKAANREALDRLTEIRDMLAACQNAPPNMDAIEKRLTDIETRLCCKLTEASYGKLVPMSDKTRISLVAQTLPRLTKGLTDVHNILKERWITEDNFDIWYARLLRAFEKKFSEATWVDPEGDGQTRRIVEHIAECVDVVGDPRRGT